MNDLPYDKAIALVRMRYGVCLFLYKDGDDLCHRARASLHEVSSSLEAKGYKVIAVSVDENSSHYEETACVRVPQLRVFSRSRLKSKFVGNLDYQDIISSIDDL